MVHTTGLKRGYSAIILNAGSGKRYGKTYPKQYEVLGTKEVYEYAIETVLKVSSIKEIVIVSPAIYWCKFAKYNDKRIIYTEGGDVRQQSVYNGLQKVTFDRVMIHETVRPFVTKRHIEDGYVTLKSEYGASYSMSLIETLSTVDEGGYIQETLNRDKFRTLQCPQFFWTDILKDLHDRYKVYSFTDDTKLLKAGGFPVKLLNGDMRLTKLTYPIDKHVLETVQTYV